MEQNIELDPAFDTSVKSRVRNMLKGLLGTRYLMIALIIHLLFLFIFGGKILFESFQKVNLESQSLIAPRSDASLSPPPPAAAPSKSIDVKMKVPENSRMMSKLATSKLSESFNVITPDVQNNISLSMDSGLAMGGTGGGGMGAGGSGNGNGMATVNFFGISGKANKIVICVDASQSMGMGKEVGHSYEEVVNQVKKCLSALKSDNEFGLVVFIDKAYAYKPKLTSVTHLEAGKAASWVARFNPENRAQTTEDMQYVHYKPLTIKGKGSTRPDLGLEQSINLKPEMIMFITDGEPNSYAGGGDVLIENVKSWLNKAGLKTPINTIYYHTGKSGSNNEGKDIVRKLARATKGEYKDVE